MKDDRLKKFRESIHDARNYLTALRLNLEVALDGVERNSESAVSLREALEQVESLTREIEDIRNLVLEMSETSQRRS